MKNTTTVKIPASVTHDHAYAYGYVASSLLILGNLAQNTDENDLWELKYLMRRIKEEAKLASELDADLSRRADARIKQFLNA